MAINKNDDPQIVAVSAVSSHSMGPNRIPVSSEPVGIGADPAGELTVPVLTFGVCWLVVSAAVPNCWAVTVVP
jgi:hypothetical protein